MSFTLIVGLAAAGMAVLAGRRALTPRCPRCRSKEWDRRLCAPLLFCRRCASRIDHAGKLYN
jgi:ribosomal protein L37AE/L43A